MWQLSDVSMLLLCLMRTLFPGVGLAATARQLTSNHKSVITSSVHA